MIDEEYLKEVTDKIYKINCKGKDCEYCKNGLKWCPKTYADEVTNGLYKILSNVNTCEDILKQLK